MTSSFTPLDLGAKVLAQGVSYTLWAPEHAEASVQILDRAKRIVRSLALAKTSSGYFQGMDPIGQSDDLYTFTIDGDENIPDFISHYQPQGVFGPSQVIDPNRYLWKNPAWQRPTWGGQVIYELHVGTFTPQGTFLAVIEKLDYLKNLGVTAIELLPIAAWAGERNWGYDGVMLFAPSHTYGSPDDLRTLVDACHSRGLAIILDVVFNHLGPVGNVSPRFSKYFFHQEKNTPWGKNYDLDGANSGPVRAYLLQNIRYWLDEFRFDGFRMDATHAIHDESPRHLLAEVADLVHQSGGFVIAEDERNWSAIVSKNNQTNWGFDAVWADDFCHAIRTSQTQQDEIFRDAYTGTLSELATLLDSGWLYQGQIFPFSGKNRGTPCRHLAPDKFIFCLTNHDQSGNRPGGEYLHQLISPAQYRAVSLFFLLTPYTPMLFMGQEWGTNSDFHYFTDLPGELGKKIRHYRQEELSALFWKTSEKEFSAMADPQALSTFQNSKLSWDDLERAEHHSLFELYREGLRLRREFFGIKNPTRDSWTIETTDNSLSIFYQFAQRRIEVRLNLGLEEKEDDPASAILLFSSRSAESGATPETKILEIKS